MRRRVNNEMQMNNQTTVYFMYEIDYRPNHFFSNKAVEKYNSKLNKWCNHLKDDATDLKKVQKIKRFFYIRYLEIFDFTWYIKEVHK